jgi:hypothetical protein
VLAIAGVLAALLAGTATVRAPDALASPSAVIRDCSEDGVLNGSYSQSDIANALEQLPSDLDEYTDCRSVIRAAQLSSAAGKHTGGRKKGVAERVDKSAPPSGREQKRIGRATGSKDTVEVGGARIRPGASAQPIKTAGLGTELPLFVLVLVAGMVGALLWGAVFGVVRAARAGGPLGKIGDGVRRGVSRLRR